MKHTPANSEDRPSSASREGQAASAHCVHVAGAAGLKGGYEVVSVMDQYRLCVNAKIEVMLSGAINFWNTPAEAVRKMSD